MAARTVFSEIKVGSAFVFSSELRVALVLSLFHPFPPACQGSTSALGRDL